MNQTLEAIARAIFKSWFVDFDPVHAKAEGRDPIGMDAATAALFPDRFEDSELGPIPAGWRVVSAIDEYDVILGQSPPGSSYNETGNGPPFYQGRADFGFRYPERRVYCTEPKRFARKGDTLVSVRAPVGDVNMAIEECCIGRGLWAIRHKSGSRSYTYYAMQQLKELFDRFNAEGTVFGSLSKRKFKGIDVVAPPSVLVGAFENLVCSFDERIESNLVESRILAELRDTLLPKLISGELRVPEEAMRQDLQD
jgi:type I restriction enzyme S subunit